MDNEYEPININPNVGITFKGLNYRKARWNPRTPDEDMNTYVFASPTYYAKWERHGLAIAECDGQIISEKHTLEEFDACTCGIWSAWEDWYATSYRQDMNDHKNIMSALFIGQNYGYAVYDNAKTCRSEQYQIVAAVESGGSISASIGAEYFGVPVVTLQVARLLVDIQLYKMADMYGFEYELQYSSMGDFKRFRQTIQLGG